MTNKPGGQICKIREQIIEDPISGLTLQFKKRENGGCAIYIHPCGRDLGFDVDGNHSDAGSHISCAPKPTWIKEVSMEKK